MKILNFFLKIFFCRITKKEEKIIDNYQILSFDLTINGIASRGYGNYKLYKYYYIEYFINPITNKFIGKSNIKKIITNN
jgi:hypothetical protein